MIALVCPCGHIVRTKPLAVGFGEVWIVECPKCGRRAGPCATEKEVIKAWRSEK